MSKKIETARKMLLDHVREVAEANGLSQQDLADKAGFERANVSRMLSGKFPPTLDNFIKLCEAAGCYLFIIDKEADDELCETMRNRWGKVSKN